MNSSLPNNQKGVLSRRHFLYLAGAGSLAFLVGCASSPVTGRPQLMLVSEEREIEVDRENSPHQISADYGRVQDDALNDYVASVGSEIAKQSHRPDMPYSYNVLNASYVNAYAFPAGTIGVSRGILLNMNSEAELASLIGHEVGHVSARHTAQRMSQGILTSVALTGLVVAAEPEWEQVVGGLGSIGAGALLASYSRNQEREADKLGLQYMAEAGYSPRGYVGLMEMLKEMSHKKKSFLQVLFSTHPMSRERYKTAVERADEYSKRNKPVYRERYMDNTASLRRIREAIEEMQEGNERMANGEPEKAREHYAKALKTAPEDYAANLKMAKCQIALEKPAKARKYSRAAREIYPEEPQAHHVLGITYIQLEKYEQALQQFNAYKEKLPGNPNTVFFQGYSLEAMDRKSRAAEKYHSYLEKVNRGKYAEHAHKKLKEWGYI
ncbi:MAG: M48 family metalloprotease [Desulfohalobiaceae bacterium]|nr:M48 family metalloprotease [Desulfohalobiaceae bacterium]